MKRIISLFLIIVTVLTCTVCIAEDVDRPIYRYSYTGQIQAKLLISGSTATCIGKVTGLYGNTYTHIRVTLQRRAIGSSKWSYVTSWTKSTQGTVPARVEEDITVSSGYDYRVYVRGRIYDSNDNTLETPTCYSSVVRF